MIMYTEEVYLRAIMVFIWKMFNIHHVLKKVTKQTILIIILKKKRVKWMNYMKRAPNNWKCLIGIKEMINSLLEGLFNQDVSLM